MLWMKRQRRKAEQVEGRCERVKLAIGVQRVFGFAPDYFVGQRQFVEQVEDVSVAGEDVVVDVVDHIRTAENYASGRHAADAGGGFDERDGFAARA